MSDEDSPKQLNGGTNMKVWARIGTVIIVVAALVGALWIVFQFGLTVGRRSERDTPAPVHSSTAYTGYFRDVDKDRSSYTTKENITLTFTPQPDSPGFQEVLGLSKGEVLNEKNIRVNRTWELRGFRTGDSLVLAYHVSQDNTSSGSGVYYLKPFGESYQGYWIGKDNISGMTVKCAYVLSKNEESIEKVEKTFGLAAKDCEFVDEKK